LARAAPGPVRGLPGYRGRGGGAGSVSPRGPRLGAPGRGAAARVSAPDGGTVTGVTRPGVPDPVRAGAL